MRRKLPSKIDRQRWLDRLGVQGEPSLDLQIQMAKAENQLFGTAMPQGIYSYMPVEIITPSGKAIKKHLNGCKEIVLMGVTLGALVDNLIKISQIRDMAEAVIIDSGASVLVEQICDELEAEIRNEADLYLTGRFSPGYGDYPVTLQAELIWLLDAQRKIGLTVNESHIMIPRKSVTAILGASEEPVKGYRATCEECQLFETCILRKEGRTCG